MAFVKWFNEGNTFFQKNQYEEAIKCWEKALEMGRDLQNDQVQAKSLMNIGTAYSVQKEWNKALKFFHQGLEIEKKLGDDASIAEALMKIGDMFFALDQWENARNYYRQSIETFSEDDGNKARILLNLGLALFHEGDWRESSKYYEESLMLFKKLEDIDGMSAVLANLGITARNLGNWEEAIRYYKQSLEIDKQRGDQAGAGTCLLDTGVALEILGKVKEAINYYQQSLTIFREVGDEKAIATCLLNIGNAFQILKKWNKALQFYEQSLALFKQLDDKSNISKCLTNVGIVLGKLGDWDRAIREFHGSIKWFESVNDQAALSKALVDLGVAYYNKEKLDEAVKYYYRSRELFKRLGDRPGEALACQNLGWAFRRQNKIQQALKFFTEALGIYTTLITPISSEEFRESYAKEFMELPKVIEGLTDMLRNSAEYQEVREGLDEGDLMNELLTQLKANVMNLSSAIESQNGHQDISQNISGLMQLVERTALTFSHSERLKEKKISQKILSSVDLCDKLFRLYSSCVQDADIQRIYEILKDIGIKLHKLFPDIDVVNSIQEKMSELEAIPSKGLLASFASELQFQILTWIGRVFNITISNRNLYREMVGVSNETLERIEIELKNIFNRLKSEEINYSKQVLAYLIVINKKSGIPLYQWNFIEAAFDSTLVGGFLTAIQSFGSEITREKTSMEKLAYKNFEINFEDGKYVRCALILRGPLTQLLLKRMKGFVLDFEKQFEKNLIEDRGNLSLFNSTDKLIQKYFVLV